VIKETLNTNDSTMRQKTTKQFNALEQHQARIKLNI